MDSKLEQAKEWVDAEKVWEIIVRLRADMDFNPDLEPHVEDLESLLPTPPLPTLGGMSLDELKTYVGGEVMVDGWANPTMLVSVIGDEGAVLARRLNKPWPFVEVRPLSDLTPVKLPGQETENIPEPVQPRPEDVPPGEPWIVLRDGKRWVGVNADTSYRPWSITRMDGLDHQNVDDSKITLVSRLVPECKENA